MRIALPLVLFLAAHVVNAQEAHTLLWSHTTEAARQPAVLVADLTRAPGLETIAADAHGSRLVCLDAGGNVLWRTEPAFRPQVMAAPALGANATPGRALVAVQDGDAIVCLRGDRGTEEWRHAYPGGGPVGVLWCDVDDDTWEDVVYAGARVIGVRDARGDLLWQVKASDAEPSFALRGSVAAMDVDGDGFSEVFALDAGGPLAFDYDGNQRWRATPGGVFAGDVVLADTDDDTFAELYAVAAPGPCLYAYDADLGDQLWKTRFLGEVDPEVGVSIAVGDLDNDQKAEIVVGDSAGGVHVFAADGAHKWTVHLTVAAAVALSLGDVDGDGAIEVVAAGADGVLHVLGPDGSEELSYTTARALPHAAALVDINQNDQTGLVFAGRDACVRCLTQEKRYRPRLMPWPGHRGGPARTGAFAALSSDFLDDAEEEGPVTISDTVSMLALGSFEVPAAGEQPLGWTAEAGADAAWARDTETKLIGEASLRVEPAGEPCVIVSEFLALDSDLRSVSGSVLARGEAAASAVLRWIGGEGIVQEDALKAAPPRDDGWRRFNLSGVEPPAGAQHAMLALTTDGDGPAWWDGAQLNGRVERLPKARIFYNQFGYETKAPKRFTAWSNVMPGQAGFEVLNEADERVHTGKFALSERITGAYGRPWGGYYAQGDFSAFDQPGEYRIKVTFDGATATSQTFSIGPGLLWERLLPVLLDHIDGMRAGVDVPDFHEAWHTDDAYDPAADTAVDLVGGWYDDGRFAKENNVAIATALADAYRVAGWKFDEDDANRDGTPDLLEILRGGAPFLRKMAITGPALYAGVQRTPGYLGEPGQDTDNERDTGDERHAVRCNAPGALAYALALLARTEGEDYARAAMEVLEAAEEAGAPAPVRFGTAMQLQVATGDNEAGAIAQALYPGMEMGKEFLPYSESLIAYDDEYGAFTSVKLGLENMAFADNLVQLAQNPFGVVTYGPPQSPHFFAPPDADVQRVTGNTVYLLRMALAVARAYRFNPKSTYLNFVHDQINWILGNNPAGVSLIEEVGRDFLPAYHSYLVFAGLERGALPGAVARGFVPRGPGDDRPYIDMRPLDLPDARTNVCTTDNAARLVQVLAHLKRLAFLGISHAQ
ncbi:MAG: glycoside hydrolase family 9 protein [Candidatus Hydrogenedentota bacterium]